MCIRLSPRDVGGSTGLLAGCGFAVHILKAYLDFDPTQWRATIRTYVDDVTLSYVGTSARDVARALGKELPLLKRRLPSRCMLSNDAKEQLYSPTVGVLHLWKRTQRADAGTLSKRAKDLGDGTKRGSMLPAILVKRDCVT